jgi:uncharacterized membrane protein YhaH (DUF805 family)
MDYVRLLFSFKGRINRARYLVVQLVLLTVWFLFWVKAPFQQFEILGLAAVIPMIWINLATVAKRLHDRNRNGWWAVAILVVDRLSYLYYGLFFGLSFGVDISIAEELLLVMGAVVLSLLQTWIVIELFFVIGTDGPNRFGPDPTRTDAASPIDPRPEPDGVPDFLVRRAGTSASLIPDEYLPPAP